MESQGLHGAPHHVRAFPAVGCCAALPVLLGPAVPGLPGLAVCCMLVVLLGSQQLLLLHLLALCAAQNAGEAHKQQDQRSLKKALHASLLKVHE